MSTQRRLEYPGDHAEAGFEARAAVAIDAGEGPQWGDQLAT
jgi:hypothetical protein